MKHVVLSITGMSCGHCVGAVKQALGAVPGVEVKSVAIGRAEVAVPAGGASDEALRAAVTAAGYQVTELAGAQEGSGS